MNLPDWRNLEDNMGIHWNIGSRIKIIVQDEHNSELYLFGLLCGHTRVS